MGNGTLSNAEILARMDSALKGITDVSEFGDSVLQPQKFDQFVQRMEDRTVVIPESRFLEMEAQQTDIDRTGFVGRILHSGDQEDGAHRNLEENEFAKPDTWTNKLVAKELHAITSIRDRALRRNIERGNFESTLVDLFGQAAGRDFEEYALLGDTGYTHAQDDVLSKTDGWFKKAGNKVYAGNTSDDFDPEDVESILQACLDALPKRFLQNVTDWRYYVPFRVLDAYRDVLRARGTSLGDTTQWEAGAPTSPSGGAAPLAQLAFKGIPLVFVPLLERAKESAAPDDGLTNGEMVMLSNPDNQAWGVFHEVTIEDEREAKKRRTDFVLTFEGDVHFEDEDGAVVAFSDKQDPTA